MLERSLSDGVGLRLLEERDAAELAQVVEENRESLSRWLPWVAANTEQSSLEFIRLTRRQLADNGTVNTTITVGGRIAGMVGFRWIDWDNQSAELGYWLAEPYRGRGVMTAALRAYLDHAFGTLDLHRVQLEVATENVRSRAVAERVGLVEEGILREAELVGAERYDLVIYSMLATDWVQDTGTAQARDLIK